MNRIAITIREIQHISTLTFSLNLTEHKIHCIVGRNSVGKTTLVRAFRNLSNADTFVKTANPRIFRNLSQIEYVVDDITFMFTYDSNIKTINCRSPIPDQIRSAIVAELPMPFGERFNFAKSASDADEKIRLSIALQNYERPRELIDFLQSIYNTERYARLIEVSHKGRAYYAIEQDGGTYIREDYFSSGEFFLINLYRTIKNQGRLIVIDEIDLSLDAAAQAHLLGWLRAFCQRYMCSILFTTHSLAVMRTLEYSELSYFDLDNGIGSITQVSYSYAKARLFGFAGFDRYILTEDIVLAEFIDHLIEVHCSPCFYKYKLIYIGGAGQVISLLDRNASEKFLSQPKNVIAVIDGDQRGSSNARNDGIVHLTPIEDVEKELLRLKGQPGFPFTSTRLNFSGGKDYFKHLRDERGIAANNIYSYIIQENLEKFIPLITTLKNFLGLSSS